MASDRRLLEKIQGYYKKVFGIPSEVEKARAVLAYIDEHGDKPPSVRGGQAFANTEGLLPQFTESREPIQYRDGGRI